MSNCRKSNQVIFIPRKENLKTFPAWYVVYKGKEEKPYPRYVLDQIELDTYSYYPDSNLCSTVWNSQETGKCDLIFAFCSDPVNVYGGQTADQGHGENTLALSSRVMNPWGKPFPYAQQQTYTAFKDFGYWDETATNTENSFLFLTTFRPIPQSKWSLNKTFGTPIEMIDRVIQKQLTTSVPSLIPPADGSPDILTLDVFGRVINFRSDNSGTYVYPQLGVIFAIITGGNFEIEGNLLTTFGNVNLNIEYPSDTTPGVIFSV